MDIGPGHLLDIGMDGLVLFPGVMILVKHREICHDIVRKQKMIFLDLWELFFFFFVLPGVCS